MNLGMTPMTLPPFSRQDLAMAPINPVFPPPYRIETLFNANDAPSSLAASKNFL
jgi:hypothetical protein